MVVHRSHPAPPPRQFETESEPGIAQKRQGQDLGREALLTAQTLQHQLQQLLDHHQRYPESGEIPSQLVTVIGQLETAIAKTAVHPPRPIQSTPIQ